jgi:hypothetical protein
MIPPVVAEELLRSGFSPADSQWLAIQPLRAPDAAQRLLDHLHSGEAEAIVLAIEQEAELLLIDEKRGRRIATRFGLRVLGLLGLLAEAKHQGAVNDCKPLLDQLIASGFWVGSELYTRFLDEMDETIG